MVIKVQTVLLDLETAGIPANGAKAHICTLNWAQSYKKQDKTQENNSPSHVLLREC